MVIIHSKMKKMMLVVFEIIINVVFGIVINSEALTPAVQIIFVIDDAKGPIIMERRIVVVVVKIIIVFVFEIVIVVIVFGIVIGVVVVVKDPALLCLVLPLDVGIIIV